MKMKMKIKLRATVTIKANDGDFDEDDMMSDESPFDAIDFDAIDAIGVWIDNNPIEGFPEGADLDSWMVDDFEWVPMDSGGISSTNGEAKGRMSCMLPGGGGLDGQFVAYFVEGVCTRVVFSAPAYEE
jgi:hypothetical protein